MNLPSSTQREEEAQPEVVKQVCVEQRAYSGCVCHGHRTVSFSLSFHLPTLYYLLRCDSRPLIFPLPYLYHLLRRDSHLYLTAVRYRL